MVRPTFDLRLGDVREQLRELPAKSVHHAIASIPYWGLRVYAGVPSGLWGGDVACLHVWADVLQGPNPCSNFGEEQGVFNRGQGYGRASERGRYCTACGAWEGTLGNEPTPQQFVLNALEYGREVWRVLRPDGTLVLNIGDCYAQKGRSRATEEERQQRIERTRERGYHTGAFSSNSGWDRACATATGGLKPKDMAGIPWTVALAFRDSGWYLRADGIWSKENPQPSSVEDRPTVSHEYCFLFSKKPRYYYDREAVRVPLKTVEKRTERIVYNGKSEATSTFRPPNPAGHNLWTVLDIPADRIDLTPPGPDEDPRLHQLYGRALAARAELLRVEVERLHLLGDPEALETIWSFPCEALAEAHYAAFPRKLPEICIKFGSSEKGCCPDCGAPWVRVVKRSRPGKDQSRNAGRRAEADALEGNCFSPPPLPAAVATPETIGWKPGCQCPEHEPVPCTVLDFFAGSGTTGIVASELGRNFIGIEVSPVYHAIAERRLRAAYAGQGAARVRGEINEAQGFLFEEVAG